MDYFKKQMINHIKRIWFSDNSHYDLVDGYLHKILMDEYDKRDVFITTTSINYCMWKDEKCGLWLIISLEKETFRFVYDGELLLERLLTIEDLKRATIAYFEISGIDFGTTYENNLFYIGLRNSISKNVLKYISPYSEMTWDN